MSEAHQAPAKFVNPPDWVNPAPKARYDLVVLGGGSAGLIAASAAAGLGAAVALVEKHALGGDCLNVGCVPSKALIRSAKVIGELRRGALLGVHSQPPRVDFAAVMQRVHDVQAEIAPHDSAERYKSLGVDVFFGAGSFADATNVAVGDARLNFRKAIIATGSRPTAPPFPGLAEAGFLTNETVWKLTQLPRRLVVVGGGPIGCELAQAFARLGSAVTLIDIAPHVLPREDADAAHIVQAALLADGVKLVLPAKVLNVERLNDGVRRLMVEHGGAQQAIAADEILVAAGRAPNTEGLNLDAAGIKFDKTGVHTDDFARTSNPRVFAAGDVTLKYKFTHSADFSARAALRNALFAGRERLSTLVIPWVTYTDPEVAHVGLYEAEAKQQGMQVDTFTVPLHDVDRGKTDGEHEGFTRVHARKGSDTIVGATIVAPHAGEMINEITLAMRNGIGLKGIAATIHPYPTAAESVRKTADAWNRTRLTDTVKRLSRFWLRLGR